MKILHLFDHSLPHYDGYAFRSREILRFERNEGIETLQLTSPKHEGKYAPSETIEGFEFFRTATLGGAYALPVLDQFGVVVATKRRLRELVARYKPDIIHAHSPSLNGLAALSIGRATNTPVVYEVRSFWEDAAVDAGVCREGDLRYRLTRASETHVIRNADHIVPICQGINTDLISRGLKPERSTVISNAVDFSRFDSSLDYHKELARRYSLAPGKTLGFAGSFFAFEGLTTLIEAMSIVRKRVPEVRLLMVGDGVERSALEASASAQGVDDAVVFTGRVPHAEIESYYSVMDTLIYPRISMRLTELVTPLKPLEAMAYGKAVIASDVGGHRELIENGVSGLLFRAGDANALADSICRLLADAELRSTLSANAKQRVRAHHNWATNIAAYSEIYRRVLV